MNRPEESVRAPVQRPSQADIPPRLRKLWVVRDLVMPGAPVGPLDQLQEWLAEDVLAVSGLRQLRAAPHQTQAGSAGLRDMTLRLGIAFDLPFLATPAVEIRLDDAALPRMTARAGHVSAEAMEISVFCREGFPALPITVRWRAVGFVAPRG